MKRLYISKAVKRQVLAQQEGKCRDCKTAFGPLDDIEWDHILEVALGGDSTAKNIQALHLVCHKAKTRSFARSHAKLKRLSAKAREGIMYKALKRIGAGALEDYALVANKALADAGLK